MKIEKIKEEYYAASESVSELVRQLSFAGIAVIWVIKIGKDESGGVAYSTDMAGSLIMFVAALSCDLLQYAYKSIVWGALNTFHWRKHKDESIDVDISGLWNWPTLLFFWAKAGLCLIAYVTLLRKIYSYL